MGLFSSKSSKTTVTTNVRNSSSTYLDNSRTTYVQGADAASIADALSQVLQQGQGGAKFLGDEEAGKPWLFPALLAGGAVVIFILWRKL